jgi:hypothetical protein
MHGTAGVNAYDDWAFFHSGFGDFLLLNLSYTLVFRLVGKELQLTRGIFKAEQIFGLPVRHEGCFDWEQVLQIIAQCHFLNLGDWPGW